MATTTILAASLTVCAAGWAATHRRLQVVRLDRDLHEQDSHIRGDAAWRLSGHLERLTTSHRARARAVRIHTARIRRALAPQPIHVADTGTHVDTGEIDVRALESSPWWDHVADTSERLEQLRSAWTMREPLGDRIEARIRQMVRWWRPWPVAAVIEPQEWDR